MQSGFLTGSKRVSIIHHRDCGRTILREHRKSIRCVVKIPRRFDRLRPEIES
jgi:hypothetical protein